MKLKIFLTFDHELPLGNLKSSYQKALFQPTNTILDIAENCGVPVTLFTDILCAFRYKTWDYHHFYLPYQEQLQDAVKRNHDVQLHIHPHWLTSDFENGTFLPSRDFGLDHFKNDTRFGGIKGVIETGINSLEQICRPALSTYSCVAFRAGGYNIRPSGESIFSSLYDCGIRYDSSMARGFYFKSDLSVVDFTQLPHQANWIVDAKDFRKASADPGILEIPIATIPKKIFELPTRIKLKKLQHRAPPKHGEMIHNQKKTGWKHSIKILRSARMLSFDNYTLSTEYLLQILKYNLAQFKETDELLLSIISHPKSMGQYAFRLMSEFISQTRKLYPNAEFMTFSQLHHQRLAHEIQ